MNWKYYIHAVIFLFFVNEGNSQNTAAQNKLLFTKAVSIPQTYTGEIKVAIDPVGNYLLTMMDPANQDSVKSSLKLSQLNFTRVVNWMKGTLNVNDSVFNDDKNKQIRIEAGEIIMNSAVNNLISDDNGPLAGVFTFRDSINLAADDNELLGKGAKKALKKLKKANKKLLCINKIEGKQQQSANSAKDTTGNKEKKTQTAESVKDTSDEKVIVQTSKVKEERSERSVKSKNKEKRIKRLQKRAYKKLQKAKRIYAPSNIFTLATSINLRTINLRSEVDGAIEQLKTQIKAKNADSIFLVKDIVFEFEEGFISGMDVKGTINGTKVIYSNLFPIGFSTLKDKDNLKNTFLFSNYQKRKLEPLRLSDLIEDYDYERYDSKREYNPANGVVSWTKEDDKKTLEVFHAKTNELFVAKVFSDFIGLDETKPNGLVQTEISRRFNLVTRRKQMLGGQSFNYGWLSFITPMVGISKIEENNKFIPLQEKYSITNGVLVKSSYISKLDLIQFQNMKAGLCLNAYLLDIPNFKSTFTINLGLNLVRTGVVDSIKILNAGLVENTNVTDKFNVTSILLYPEACWHVLTDSRINILLSYKLQNLFMYSDKVKPISNIKKYESMDSNKYLTEEKRKYPGLISTFSFLLTFKPNGMLNNNPKKPNNKVDSREKNELFFRFSYSHLNSEIRRNYFQAQVGYSFYLLKKTQ